MWETQVQSLDQEDPLKEQMATPCSVLAWILLYFSLSKRESSGITVGWLPWCLSNVGDVGLIPGSGRSPGEGNGNPLHFSCLGNPVERGAWWATVCVVAKSQT